MSKIKDLEWQLHWLQEVFTSEPEFVAAKEKILKRRQDEINKIRKQLEEARNNRPEPKPRWPKDVPERVLKACQVYWGGSEEYRTFRIHLWNDKAIWTSYPSGGYSNNCGWHQTSVNYDLINIPDNLETATRWSDFRVLDNIRRRTSRKELQSILDEKTKSL